MRQYYQENQIRGKGSAVSSAEMDRQQNNLGPNWRLLWGKTDENEKNRQDGVCKFHPLICHMLDVAAVAAQMWDHCLAQPVKGSLEAALGDHAREQIIFWAGVHDLGKANPYFQQMRPEISKQIGLPFSVNDQGRPHGFIGSYVLQKHPGPKLLAMITGGHHGLFPQSLDLSNMGTDILGNKAWDVVRKDLLQKFSRITGFCLVWASPSDEFIDPAIVPILTGLITVADWIGSNQKFFPCVAEVGDIEILDSKEYWHRAQKQAEEALKELGWMPSVTFTEEAAFNDIFVGYKPNELQNVAVKLAKNLNYPYLMIVEAPMGQGKTETALYLADVAMCRGFARGMYVAMPTQATGNAMHERVLNDYLKCRGHKGKLNLQLVHGDALLALMGAKPKNGEVNRFAPNSIENDTSADGGTDVEAESWFTARKRTLLSPFGVGTIDQSLLSVLKTKHWFVRLFGLSGKVVIFDEVHAYDVYMNTILERLLRWLAEVGCTVILLSATLPAVRRKALLSAYSGHAVAEDRPYPRITLAEARRYPNEQSENIPLCDAIPQTKLPTVDLKFMKANLRDLSETLTQHLMEGGCAAVICNTVDRAIEVFEYLRDNMEDVEVLLFHARTLQRWRRKREAEVLSRFGKRARNSGGIYSNVAKPKRAVLVATQVIEQSLDLDFDLMVSEIAPIDLVLQRMGRLHRHSRWRPPALESPLFIVFCDAERVGPPPESFGRSIEYVYARYILLRTWLVLRQHKEIVLPNEIETLVEAVYGSPAAVYDKEWDSALRSAKQQLEHAQRESEGEASKLLICGPKDPSDLIEEFNPQLADDENPDVHKAVRAATREGHSAITVVMLPLDYRMSSNPNLAETRELLDESVKLSHPGLFDLLLNIKSPTEWSNNAHLRHTRLIRFDADKRAQIGDYILTIDELLGVVIE